MIFFKFLFCGSDEVKFKSVGGVTSCLYKDQQNAPKHAVIHSHQLLLLNWG